MAAPDAGRRRSMFWPTVVALPALAVLLGLGTWQVERRAWKEGLIAERAERLALPPLAAADLVRPPEELAFRRIRLAGRFLHDRETVIQARTRQGTGEAGAHVVTPLALDVGGAVLVDRGWVPQGRIDPARRASGQVAGRVEVAGIVTPGGRASAWTPDNDPARDEWYYADPPAIAARLRLRFGGPEAVPGLVVAADAAPAPGGLPIGGQTATDLPNRHLEYALTWYALAAALVAVYVAYWRGRRGSNR
jgi:surfeit locus 1 family protein